MARFAFVLMTIWLAGNLAANDFKQHKDTQSAITPAAEPADPAPAQTGASASAYWPQWRGPGAAGIAPNSNPPLEWSEDKNVRWKVAIPGKGLSSPIVWGEHIFLTTAIPAGESSAARADEASSQERGKRITPDDLLKFEVLAINRTDGSIAWQKTAIEARPHEGTHPDGSWASNSAVTDGEHLFVHFGSRGLYCFTMDGELVWKKHFGEMQTRNGFGEGSSPALYENSLVVVWDHEGPCFITALDKRSGEELWKTARDERTSWSTPVIVEHGGKHQVVVTAPNYTRGYDLANGKELWKCAGMTFNTIPTPLVENGIAYVTSGFRGSIVQAIRLSEARGDITNSAALSWQYEQDTPYVPSPLLYGGHLYFTKVNNAILTCLNAETGEVVYNNQRLEGMNGIYASIVGASDRIYITGRNGVSYVLENGAEFKVLAQNQLDDRFDASAAIVGDQIYLRGRANLYCIGK